MVFNTSLGTFPGFSFVSSLRRVASLKDDTKETQLCPQQFGVLREESIDGLLAFGIRLRPHANVRIEWGGLRSIDATTPWTISKSYFVKLASLCQLMGATAYSLHAGRKRSADGTARSLGETMENVFRIEEVLKIPVALEGLYPASGDPFLLSTWKEYETVLRSEVKMAVDLSHLNIVAHRYGRNDALVADMLASPKTIEIHVSANDGLSDRHSRQDGSEWWWPLLRKHGNRPGVVVFDEGKRSSPEQEKRTTLRIPSLSSLPARFDPAPTSHINTDRS